MIHRNYTFDEDALRKIIALAFSHGAMSVPDLRDDQKAYITQEFDSCGYENISTTRFGEIISGQAPYPYPYSYEIPTKTVIAHGAKWIFSIVGVIIGIFIGRMI